MGLEVKVNAKFLQDYLQEYVNDLMTEPEDGSEHIEFTADEIWVSLWDMISDTPSDFTDLLDIMVMEEEALNV